MRPITKKVDKSRTTMVMIQMKIFNSIFAHRWNKSAFLRGDGSGGV
jgi:hypothetical protein